MSKRTPDCPLKNKKGLLDIKMPLKGLKDKKDSAGVLYMPAHITTQTSGK